MIDKIKKVFLDNGYKMEIINGKEVFVKGNLYQRIDFVKDWNEYIIESAFSRDEAEKRRKKTACNFIEAVNGSGKR